MLYTIENEQLRVKIAGRGGELWSIYGKKTDYEYLWQGDPTVWCDRSPLVFPTCGLLKDGCYTYAGKRYEMGEHGFIAAEDLSVTAHTEDSITLSLTDTPETRVIYPFSFRYSVTYSLSGDTLHIAFCVENRDEKTLIFALGGHPGFLLPPEEAESYRFRFAPGTAPRQILFENNFCRHEQVDFPLENDSFAFSHKTFDEGSWFFTDIGSTVTLSSPRHPRGVRVDFAGFPVLGFWREEGSGASYVCIEPWESIPSYFDTPEALETKAMMNHLPKGGVHKAEYSVTLL